MRLHQLEDNLAEATALYTSALLEETRPENIYQQTLDVVEKTQLMIIGSKNGQNQSKTAEVMGINRATARIKLKRHGLL